MSYINPLAIVVKNAEIEVLVKGRSTGLVLEIRPPSDPAVKEVERSHRKDSYKAQSEGASAMDHAIDKMDERLNDRVVSHVAGWHWKEGVDPALSSLQYSEKQLREFLVAVPFGDEIREQVFKNVERDENFFEMPAAS